MVRACIPVCITLLFGLMLMFCTSLCFLMSSSNAICLLRRLGLGLSYGIVMSCLAIRSVCAYCRLHNYLFEADLHVANQYFGLMLLISIELTLVIEWVILKPSSCYVNKKEDSFEFGQVSVCDPTNKDLVISLVYVYALLALTIVVSARTLSQRIVEADKETLSLIISCVSSALIIISWTCSATLTYASMSDIAVCIGLMVNSFLISLTMFVPKIVLIVRLSRGQQPSCANVNNSSVFQSTQTTLSKEPITISPPLQNYDFAMLKLGY